MKLATADPRWTGETVVVAATGPSLTADVAAACYRARVLAVNDAWRLLPWAEVLYSCDAAWWKVHNGCPDFAGERWTSHSPQLNNKAADEALPGYRLNIIAGKSGDTFSGDPACLHYGNNSGFQGIGLAILFGARRIVLVGFDMRVGDRRHFFGSHPPPLRNSLDYELLIPSFAHAAKHLPAGVEILNATPGSALTCFPMKPLAGALAGDLVAA